LILQISKQICWKVNKGIFFRKKNLLLFSRISGKIFAGYPAKSVFGATLDFTPFKSISKCLVHAQKLDTSTVSFILVKNSWKREYCLYFYRNSKWVAARASLPRPGDPATDLRWSGISTLTVPRAVMTGGNPTTFRIQRTTPSRQHCRLSWAILT